MKLETRKMVAFDLDDVLADFINPFMKVCAELHNRPDLIGLPPSDWEWTNANMTATQLEEAWEVVNKTPYFWANLPTKDGINKWLIAKVVEKCNVVFPTARAFAPGPSVAVQSAMFIQENFDIQFPTVIVGNSKGPLAAALKYDFFIDDRPKNVLEVKAARPECKVYLNNASHNQTFDSLAHGIPRVPSVNEFCKEVLLEV